jgi:hypothetical protein
MWLVCFSLAMQVTGIFPLKSCLPGKTFIKKMVRSKVELKNTGLGQNNKYFGGEVGPIFLGGSKILRGEENPAFPGKLALGKKPWVICYKVS